MTLMKKIWDTMVYFFTPEDTTALAEQGNISIDDWRLDMGSLKVLFWVLNTLIGFYLITLI